MSNRTDSETNFIIGQKLQKARESANVTQQDMADATGMSKNHLSKTERGQNKASVAMLMGYCDKLGMTPNDVLGYKGKEILPSLQRLIEAMDEREQRKLLKILEVLDSD